MITPVPNDPNGNMPKLVDVPFSYERILPLHTIRSHAKVDDIPAVTDEMLELYRAAALTAAEQYTGFLLKEKQAFTEMVQIPRWWSPHRHRPTFKHTLEHPLADPVIYVYGHGQSNPRKVIGTVGSKIVRLPVLSSGFGDTCCNPDYSDPAMRLMYYAGFSCEEDIPPQVALGALKYITHCIENPGDVVKAVNEAGRETSGYSTSDAANPALASGAIEIWRSVMRSFV